MSNIQEIRTAFPYFYFVKTDDIEKALKAESAADCYAAAPFLDGGKALKLNESGHAQGVVSVLGEDLKFEAPVEISHKDDLAKWATAVLAATKEAMTREVKIIMGQIFDMVQQGSLNTESLQGVNSQALLVLKELLFSMALDDQENLEKYTAKHREFLNSLSDMTQADLSPLNRAKLNALITITVHHQDLLEADAETRAARLAIKMDGESEEQPFNVYVKDNTVPYQFGYYGHPSRLVVTPLTLKAYDNHMTALSSGKISISCGPAGTGKTETVKDLAHAMGQQTIVINCSDQMTNDIFEALFKGGKGTKAWLVFDEFNRIPKEQMEFFADLYSKSEGVTVFLTCNPGYAGRTELPESLTALCQRIDMFVPDKAVIMEVMLACGGIKDSKALGKTLAKFNEDCTEKLSKAAHYDYGLRRMKSVATAAAFARKHFNNNPDDAVIRDVVQCMYSSTLITEDLPKFEALMKEHFSGEPIKPDGAKFKEVNSELALPMELLEIWLSIRHGCIVLGEITKAESVVEALAKARGTKVFKVDGTQGVTELHGELKDGAWSDGCLTAAFRSLNSHEGEAVLLISGNTNAVNVELLNSVLDDNKVMNLPTGEQIKLEAGKFVAFAMDNVDEMSPAFISRNGVVCLK